MTRDSGRVSVLEYHGKPGYPYSGLKGVTFTDLRSHHPWDAIRAPHGCGNSQAIHQDKIICRRKQEVLLNSRQAHYY